VLVNQIAKRRRVLDDYIPVKRQGGPAELLRFKLGSKFLLGSGIE
jgi:hypothetical protein